jgi:hypothetical protein
MNVLICVKVASAKAKDAELLVAAFLKKISTASSLLD